MTRTELDTKTRAWLTLRLTPGLGARSMRRLLERFGSPEAVLRAGGRDLETVPGLRRQAKEALGRKRTLRPVEEEWEALRRRGWGIVCLDDDDYPQNLKTIPDPPPVLYVTGPLEPRDLVAVAVVGSRFASPGGLLFTERLCADLARRGVTVVSGFAVGIDTAAHRGALKAGGRTIAVLGCGLDVIYPKPNRDLRSRIAQGGALVSEFPLGTPPLAGHFPMRNRIISGLCLGVVVVEAADRSGSLITARLALEQGREVFAVPGMARHFRSSGPHRLLRQGAKLVESAEDILEEISPMVRPSWSLPESQPGGEGRGDDKELSEEAQRLLGLLCREPIHVDQICRNGSFSAARAMALLLELEMKGLVRQLPGKYFVRL
ncbi:DNA protecting protein DprA [Desulfacinum hydrothermale DSM 13146]|uniref:DNA protecting protein DprA n=1 Tax=Desulfacinum hydrothermale DSM 13146 TaxID=1121390 RepID=A0A1W1XMJ7_9BACT|nr:DNA-processing protein DprA [Desulfacinum hydrothermale]SMC25220.1 DNA protecting protein DprA [Desulfacinum hydrothermale DSM 13146]